MEELIFAEDLDDCAEDDGPFDRKFEVLVELLGIAFPEPPTMIG